MPQVSLIFHTYDVVASPVAAAETVIGIITNVDTIWPAAPINLHGWVATGVDADATGLTLRIRRGSLTGDDVSNGGATVNVAAGTVEGEVVSVDCVDLPGDVASATYVLTLQLDAASGPSTVNAVHLSAQV